MPRWLTPTDPPPREVIALVAGDFDMMNAHMQRAANCVVRAGMPARFVSLGRVGYWFPRDVTARMNFILDWLENGGMAGKVREPGGGS